MLVIRLTHAKENSELLLASQADNPKDARAAKWQLLALSFQKSEGENKSQICDFSRYFSRKGKKIQSQMWL